MLAKARQQPGRLQQHCRPAQVDLQRSIIAPLASTVSSALSQPLRRLSQAKLLPDPAAPASEFEFHDSKLVQT